MPCPGLRANPLSDFDGPRGVRRENDRDPLGPHASRQRGRLPTPVVASVDVWQADATCLLRTMRRHMGDLWRPVEVSVDRRSLHGQPLQPGCDE